MVIDHIAIWTNNLEKLKDYYENYFDGISGNKYVNDKKAFQSYFVSFQSGTRIEIMTMPNIAKEINNGLKRHQAGFAHIAFGVDSKELVDQKAKQLQNDGFQIINGPRVTGDGYYEFETIDPDGNTIEVTAKNIE